MPRVQLLPLDQYLFSWRLPVRTTDLNRADHLSAYALVGMLDEAYARFLGSLKLGDSDLGSADIGSINADLQVSYLGEGKLHDMLTIDVGIDEISNRSFRVHYRVTTDRKTIALAQIGVVCFDYRLKKTAPLPHRFLDALNAARSMQ